MYQHLILVLVFDDYVDLGLDHFMQTLIAYC